jgi:hypothetical protein
VSEADSVLFGRAELERAFTAGRAPRPQGRRGRRIHGDGAAMALAHDAARVTRDVDAMFKPHGIVHEEAMQVARDLGLPCWWLNEQASTYISGKEDADKRRVFDHPGLRVMAASPRHIFARRHARPERATSTIFACSPASSEWNQPTRPCRYARTSTRTNPYPPDPPPCSANYSADHSTFRHQPAPILPRAEPAAWTGSRHNQQRLSITPSGHRDLPRQQEIDRHRKHQLHRVTAVEIPRSQIDSARLASRSASRCVEHRST